MEYTTINLVKDSGIVARLRAGYDGHISNKDINIDGAIEYAHKRPVTIAVKADESGALSRETYQNLVRGVGFMQNFPERREIRVKLGEGLNIDVGDFQFHVREDAYFRRKAS